MADLEVSFNAVNVPTNASGTVTVYEDTNGDGTADNSNSVSLSDSTTTYSLSGFDTSSGNDVWVELSFSNTGGLATAELTESVSVESTSATANVTPQSASGSSIVATAITPDYIVWSATSDWDSLQYEEDISHSSDVISLQSSENDGEFLSNKKSLE